MNRHLDAIHGINNDNSIEAVTMPAADGTLHTAFGKAIDELQFNRDRFKALLIKGFVTNNISFRAVKQCTFHLLLSYMMACVCKISLYNYCHCHVG
jgi:hypothetical protein